MNQDESTKENPEETQAKETKDESSNQRIAELSKESASYRTQRNEALRKAHAYETILKAHNVDISQVKTESLESLPISGGKVDGVFKYKPPKIEVPKEPKAKAEGSAPVTLDEVKKWPAAKINKNWGTVTALLEKSNN